MMNLARGPLLLVAALALVACPARRSGPVTTLEVDLSPLVVAAHPEAGKLWVVTRPQSSEWPNLLTAVDLSTGAHGERLPLPRPVRAVVASAGAEHLYVIFEGGGPLGWLDGKTGQPVTDLDFGITPMGNRREVDEVVPHPIDPARVAVVVRHPDTGRFEISLLQNGRATLPPLVVHDQVQLCFDERDGALHGVASSGRYLRFALEPDRLRVFDSVDLLPPAVFDITCRGGRLYTHQGQAIDLESRREVARFPMFHGNRTLPVIDLAQGRAFFRTGPREISVLNLEDMTLDETVVVPGNRANVEVLDLVRGDHQRLVLLEKHRLMVVKADPFFLE